MKKRIIDIIYTSAVFLFTFIIVIQLLTNILFWFNITITPWHLPVELLISIIVTAGIQIFKYKKENQKKNLKKVIVNLIAAIIIGIAIFFIGTFLIGKLYDVTADGNTYHKLGIGSMKNGWNPMYESSRNFTQKDGNVLTVLEDNINYLWADHYAMGTEIIAANIYAFTNKIETGKVFTLIMMYIGFGIILEYLYKQRKWENKKFGLIKSLVISILFVLNPISIVQVGTFYVDATLAISLFIIIIELIATSSNEKSFENYFILAMAIGMCSNAKFTGLGYAAVFCAAFYIYNVIKNRKNKEYIIKQTIFYIVTVIITFGILGSTSYLKNTIVNKHPFYPLYGEGHVENMVNQEIPKSLAAKPNIMQFFISVFSKGENISPSYSTELNEPDLKIPFTVSAEEINNYTIPDIRVGGFGPLYSGIFIITIGVTIALCIDFIKNKKFDSLIIYGII